MSYFSKNGKYFNEELVLVNFHYISKSRMIISILSQLVRQQI